METTTKVLNYLLSTGAIALDNISEMTIRNGYILITLIDNVNMKDFGFIISHTREGLSVQSKIIENVDIEII